MDLHLHRVHFLVLSLFDFPGEPGLAVFSEAKDDGSGGDNWSYRSCKAPVKSSPTNQHPDFLQVGCPSCCRTNSVKALKGIGETLIQIEKLKG